MHGKGSLSAQRALNDPSIPLPPLLALPLELQQEIIVYLINDSGPGLSDLRGANKYFHSIITPVDLHKHAIALLGHRKLKTADSLFRYLQLEDELPCSLCLTLLPVELFHWNSRRKVLGSKRGHTRFCME